ncbi:MAG: ATP-binding cassette domain-containing protein [Myxococcales bacterium]|nr:ATP-binding cassette domain-containing protein [Myxococcales bacterium]
MIEFVGVVLEQAGRVRLDRLGLQVRAGEILGLVGASGAGKSAALAVAGGAARVTRGRLLLEGRDVSRKPERLRAVAALAPAEVPGPHDLAVRAWLGTWLSLDGVAKAEHAAAIDRELARFGLVPEQPVETLSGGARQRLRLARAFARRAPLTLLDDPTRSLDGEGLRALTKAVRERAADGGTVILAAAAPHLVVAVCDRAVHLEAGQAAAELRKADPDFAAGVARAQGWAA